MNISPEQWASMDASITKECANLDEGLTGVSVVLWKLRSLMAGYKYALDHGYLTEERESNP